MPLKRKYLRKKSIKNRKLTLRRRSHTVKRKTMKGGNYEKDMTTRMTDGIPTKPLNKFVITVPGYGTMSGTAYKKLHEAIDRDGPDAFFK